MDEGGDPSGVDARGRTPLHLAALAAIVISGGELDHAATGCHDPGCHLPHALACDGKSSDAISNCVGEEGAEAEDVAALLLLLRAVRELPVEISKAGAAC